MNSKYLKYAIGEIVLVVLGILIALSINNANENRKARAYEHKMLREIHEALNQDIPVFQNFDSIFNVWNNSIIFLSNEVNNRNKSQVNLDSLEYHVEVIDDIGVFSIYNSGPYESLKSSGMDKISNDLLRKDIARLYSRDLPSIDIWINGITRENIFKKYNQIDEIFDKKIVTQGKSVRSQVIIDDQTFLDNPQFHDLLINSFSIVNSTQRRMNYCRERMIAVRDDIGHELNID